MSKEFAEAVVGPDKERQELFLKLYSMGFSQEKAKSIVENRPRRLGEMKHDECAPWCDHNPYHHDVDCTDAFCDGSCKERKS